MKTKCLFVTNKIIQFFCPPAKVCPPNWWTFNLVGPISSGQLFGGLVGGIDIGAIQMVEGGCRRAPICRNDCLLINPQEFKGLMARPFQ